MSSYVAGLAFCRSGQPLVAIGEGRRVRVWDLTRDVTVTMLTRHEEDVLDLGFNFDGSLVATASADSVVRIFAATAGNCVRELRGHTDGVTSVCFFDFQATSVPDADTDGVALAGQADAAAPSAGVQFKVLVVGNPGVGKTSFIRQCAEGYFLDKYKATIGVDFSTVDVGGSDGTLEGQLALWDIAGQERFGAMNRIYFKGACGAFVMVDATDGAALETARLWKKELDEKVAGPGGDPITAVLLANKCDLPHVLSDESLDRFCEEHGFAAWLFTSAKDGTNVEQCSALILGRIKAANTALPPPPLGIQVGLAPEGSPQCCT